jgi:hypothetical protein
MAIMPQSRAAGYNRFDFSWLGHLAARTLGIERVRPANSGNA